MNLKHYQTHKHLEEFYLPGWSKPDIHKIISKSQAAIWNSQDLKYKGVLNIGVYGENVKTNILEVF